MGGACRTQNSSIEFDRGGDIFDSDAASERHRVKDAMAHQYVQGGKDLELPSIHQIHVHQLDGFEATRKALIN
ncbi:MAG: hypothetical protein Q9187_006693 [Circinaria calcarea]